MSRRIARWNVAFTPFLLSCGAATADDDAARSALRFEISFPASVSESALDGRLLLMLSTEPDDEPRFQISDGPDTQLIFGDDVEGMIPDRGEIIDGSYYGFPIASLAEVPAGT
jgi:hypothetical protein